jgi:hypothetical protein
MNAVMNATTFLHPYDSSAVVERRWEVFGFLKIRPGLDLEMKMGVRALDLVGFLLASLKVRPGVMCEDRV